MLGGIFVRGRRGVLMGERRQLMVSHKNVRRRAAAQRSFFGVGDHIRTDGCGSVDDMARLSSWQMRVFPYNTVVLLGTYVISVYARVVRGLFLHKACGICGNRAHNIMCS